MFFCYIQLYVYQDRREHSLPSSCGALVFYLLLIALLGHDYLLVSREQLYHI